MSQQEMNELMDSLLTIKNNLTKMQYVMNELLCGYFEKFNPDKKDDERLILWDFKRNRAFAEILDDCLVMINSEYPSDEFINKLST